jgi:hypothetical protein
VVVGVWLCIGKEGDEIGGLWKWRKASGSHMLGANMVEVLQARDGR